MAFCALRIQPLITSLHETSTADDAGGTDSTTEMKRSLDTLSTLGPDFGYFSNGKKCWIIAKPNKKDSVKEVFKAKKDESEEKAAGPDEIPARLLKETASIIAPSLTVLSNTPLREGKLANTVPVHRKNKKAYVENYRPIPLLGYRSKSYGTLCC